MDKIFSLVTGTFRGRGTGSFPTIATFHYLETSTFERLPDKPVFLYTQRTKQDSEDGKPLHMETGFLKLLPGNRVEFALAHPFGVAEMLVGTWRYEEPENQLTLEVDSGENGMIKGPSSKPPVAHRERRQFVFTQQSMHYTMDMATSTVSEITRHLEAQLSKT
jgi:hypothetical protein